MTQAHRFSILLALTAATGAVGAQTPGGEGGPARPDPLGVLVREALARNIDLERDRLAAERADAGVREARGRLLPTFRLDARYSETSNVLDLGDLVNPAYRTLNQLTGSQRFPTDVRATLPFTQETVLRLTQPLYQPAVRAALDGARSVRSAEDAAVQGSARRLAAAVQLAYLDVARAARVGELYAATRALVAEQRRVAERLVASGLATADAVARADADLAEAEQAQRQAAQQRDAARRALNDLVGRPIDAPLELVSDSLLVLPISLSADDALRSALARREELGQARWAIRAAEQQRRAARASSLPAVSLALDYGIQGNQYRVAGDADFAVASLVMQWNLFTGGQDMARRQQAALESDRATLAERDAERRIELDVRLAHDAARVASGAVGSADARMEAAERAFRLVRRRFEEGLAPTLELVDARTAYTSAALNQILTRYDLAARWVELERAAALRSLDP